jgi:hypothetical protein
MPSPLMAVASLSSDDSEYRNSNYFAKKKKEYIQIIDKFIGKPNGALRTSDYNLIIANSRSIKSSFKSIQKNEKELHHENLELLVQRQEDYLKELVDENGPQEEIDFITRKIQKAKKRIEKMYVDIEKMKRVIRENKARIYDTILGLIALNTSEKSKYMEIIKKIIDKMVEYDKFKKEYNLRVIISTINYILIMTHRSGLWADTKRKKAEVEFFNSFEKFFTEELEDEDNTEEIISNFHEMLLHIKEKYSLPLNKNNKENHKFYKTLLLMHRYPVDTTDYDEIYDVMTMTTRKISLQKYLSKSGNIVIQVRGQYKQTTDADSNIVKKPLYIFTTRSIMLKLLHNQDSTYYGCKSISIAAQPHNSNLDKSIIYVDNINFDSIGNKFWDISIITDFPHHQIFVLQNLEEDFPTYTTISSVTKVRDSVSAWHCNVPAAKGTGKLLLGVSDSTTRPLSRSASLTTPEMSPISVDSDNLQEGLELPEPVNNTTRRRRRIAPEPAPVPAPEPVPVPAPAPAPGRGRGRPPRIAPEPAPANNTTRRRGRPRINQEATLDDIISEIRQQSTAEDAEALIDSLMQSNMPPPGTPNPRVQESATEREIQPVVEESTSRSRGRPRINPHNLTRHRRVGEDCEHHSDCVNNNCVNNRCTRREHRSQPEQRAATPPQGSQYQQFTQATLARYRQLQETLRQLNRRETQGSRRIGDRCEEDRECINGNCVNNVCTRRPHSSRQSDV